MDEPRIVLRPETSHNLIKDWARENNYSKKKMKNNGIEIWNGLYEFYLTSPDEQPDLNNWETEFLYAIN